MKLYLAAIAVVLLGVCGCTQLDNALLREDIREEVAVQTNQVIQILPNGLIFTNVFVNISTNYFTNYVANPDAERIIKSTEAIPVYGGLISLFGTTLLGFYRAFRNKRVAEAAVLATEAGRVALVALGDGADKTFKSAMVEEQKNLGEKAAIGQIVDRKTRRTTRR